ncbi:MAG TPA: LytTR family DNA-binding domain-containing protein [Arenimonas sp.]|uniref:LytTR family DNA-binding domain-containing protein n=1 Tax=Arenimonas sp. TaxID=1872635 RepID=UPI002D7E7B20|nr:LytTR family DNA-binding domain-containing protein [Arenimonas sp.]HEU0152258.1 LytTR family DNA-binding domain-containing protein [Arenimonas sp.]
MMANTPPAPGAYERFLPYRRWVEWGYWLGAVLVSIVGNALTTGMEMRRAGLAHHPAEPWIWEGSSNLVFLVLVPLVAWFTRRYPLHLDTWRRRLPAYLLASVAFSGLHVAGMVALRMAIYASAGEHYDFGPWGRQFAYEYLKDVRTFAGMVLLMAGYRFLLRRLQGEASLLAAPDDDAAPVEPIERPERFLVRKLGREFLVAAADIEWLQASGNYVNLRVRGRDYPLRSTISAIESRLDPARFQRVHRSHIVNLDHVASIEPLDTGDARIHLRDGGTLPCSRRYRAALRERTA